MQEEEIITPGDTAGGEIIAPDQQAADTDKSADIVETAAVDAENTETVPEGWKGNVARFVTSQTVSLVGSSMVRYAIIWLVTLRTQSGLMVMVGTLCSFLPQLIISFFAGLWADKYNRKAIIIIADLSIAATSLCLAVLMSTGFDALWLMFTVSALGSLFQGIQSPAVGAFTTQITPKSKLMTVNGINTSVQSAVMLLSPVLSGLILSAAGMWLIFSIDVVTAVCAVTILIFLRPGAQYGRQPHDGEATFRQGVRYIRDNKYILDMVVFLGLMMFLITPAAMLSPLQVTRTFGDDVWYLTGIEIAFSVGMTVGGVLVGTMLKRFKKARIAALATFVLGALTVSLAFLDFNYFVYCIPMVLTGVFVPMFNIPLVTLFQENVRPDMMGRVFAFVTLINSCMFPLGMTLFGPLADMMPVEWLMLITGVLQSAFVIFALKGRWNKITPRGNKALG